MSESLLQDVIDLGDNAVLKNLQDVSYEKYDAAVKAFVRQSSLRLKAGGWLFDERPHESYLKGDIGDFKILQQNLVSSLFTPFVEKHVAEPGDQFVIIGDIHGDIKMLVSILTFLQESGYLDKDFQIIEEGFHIVFLGDYTNFGNFSFEVTNLIFHLFHQNIGKVFVLRGNHEYAVCNKDLYEDFEHAGRHDLEGKDTFIGELARKLDVYYYPDLLYWYDYLPLSFYLGCKDEGTGVTQYIQLCHAGLEVGFSPQQLLMSPDARFQKINKLNRYNAMQKLKSAQSLKHLQSRIDEVFAYLKTTEMSDVALTYLQEGSIDFSSPQSPCKSRLGMQWNNFLTDENDNIGLAASIEHKSMFFGSEITKHFLKSWSTESINLLSIVNSHQHFNAFDEKLGLSSEMVSALKAQQGCVKLSEGNIYTLGDSGVTSGYHSFIMIDIAPDKKEWHVNHFYKEVDGEYFERTPYKMFGPTQE